MARDFEMVLVLQCVARRAGRALGPAPEGVARNVVAGLVLHPNCESIEVDAPPARVEKLDVSDIAGTIQGCV